MRRWLLLLVVVGCTPDKVPPCMEGTARDQAGQCLPVATTGDEPVDSADPVPEDTGAPSPVMPSTTDLSTPRLLRRVSLDLLGVLPMAADLDTVEADPEALAGIIDSYLEDPRLEARLVAILGEIWHTQVDAFLLEYLEYPVLRMDPQNEFPFERSAGDEPLRLMAYVGARDLAWTEILTADYTMANEVTTAIWPIELEEGAGDWTKGRYTDGRPAAGVLATNGLWLRYYSAGTNRNRGRAAAISRLLICEDFLARPVSFSDFPSLADVDGTDRAIKEDPYCMGCHSAIDPIAAALFGFWAADIHNGTETGIYHLEREHLGEEILEVEAHWFGTPVSGLAALSRQIAQDSRFRSCAAQTMARGLWRREVDLADFGTILALRKDFETGELRLRPLIKAVLQTPAYRAGSLTAEASEADGEREHVARLLMPGQLHTAVEDLTGFSWWHEGFDQMANDTYGYRIMAGGVNGYHVTRPQVDPSVTHALVVQRLAEAGADTVVTHDLTEGSEDPRLFGELQLDHRPGDVVFDHTLETLYWRLLARRPSAEDTTALAALWSAAEAASEPATAWTAVLSALLRDPEFVSY